MLPRLAAEPGKKTNEDLVRKATVKGTAARAEIDAVRAEIALHEERAGARAAAKRASLSASATRRAREATLMLAVTYDDKYSCPICTEVLEAAVDTGGVCDHVFCRGCLERRGNGGELFSRFSRGALLSTLKSLQDAHTLREVPLVSCGTERSSLAEFSKKSGDPVLL